MAGNQYLPFAHDPGANVEDPATWLANGVRTDGFVDGVADPAEANTALRQATVAAAGVAQAVIDELGGDMDDDGDPQVYGDRVRDMIEKIAQDEIDAAGSFGWGGIYGLTLSNTPGFTTTRVSVAVGQCRDSTNTANIVVATPFSKSLTSVWAAGDGNGGRDQATALAAGQTWHFFVIYNPTTDAEDGLFSQSPTAPTLPTDFTKFRRVGSIILEAASTNIRQFLQTGDWFSLITRSADYAAQANGGGPFLRTVTVPVGIKVEALFYFQSTGAVPATATAMLSGLYDPDQGVPAAFGGSTQWAQIRRISVSAYPGSWNSYGTVIARQFTDTNAQIYTFSSDADDVIALGVVGWRDDRGRFL